jgi:hypothetical protein
MPDDLYDRDVLAWSQHQADLLRRVSRGERVNGVDWEHVVEEVEDVGLSQLNAVRSYLRLMLVHLMKIHCWPAHEAVRHWRGEIATFQQEASQRFAPSMRQRIDLGELYQRALRQLTDADDDGDLSHPVPATCPFTLDQLLNERRATLEAMLVAPQ